MTITLHLGWLDLLWITPLVLYALWWNFIATMSIRDRWDQLTRTNKVLAGPPVLFSFLQDVLANLLIATVAGWEWPRQWTLTERFKRWKTMAASSARRAAVAWWACKHINQFDPGHC
ncbi:hypothetical protein [Hydrogenophaga sp.]|uniref:hypothetical protein n=1 Tax=Hydrogenophaga sp. TaxID=1904254 RepID=UPI0027303690|nr:hypothetical protein [Hydrogenophaga sp.]MDP2018982.1 hypothetical protein [Hydrogenophaga sp.]MDP3164360.1 hypothetical protein [Hydrogenophaga sp.]